jgi:hypothetical protein
MKTEQRLKHLFDVLLGAVKRDPSLRLELEQTLGVVEQGPVQRISGARNRRKPAAFDPFTVYEQDEAALRARLEALDVESLKDIVSEFGMDPAKLVQKWKTSSRLVDHIVATVQARSRKGDAFRS